MNSGSIHNPRTKEGQLFAFMRANMGVEFTTIQIANQIVTACAHTYIDGMRDQVELIGYQVMRTQRGKLHYYKLVKADKTFTPSPSRPKPRPAKRVKHKESMSMSVASDQQMEFCAI